MQHIASLRWPESVFGGCSQVDAFRHIEIEIASERMNFNDLTQIVSDDWSESMDYTNGVCVLI